MAPRTKGSSKPARTEIVGVRLDPRLRYLSEIAARAQHRSLSSFVEFALDHALGDVSLNDLVSVRDEAGFLWDVDEVDRWVYLAFNHPGLMTVEEQTIWKLVKKNGWLWRGNYNFRKYVDTGDWAWEVKRENLLMPRLRAKWDIFLTVARGEADESELPNWEMTKQKPSDWDDIPF